MMNKCVVYAHFYYTSGTNMVYFFQKGLGSTLTILNLFLYENAELTDEVVLIQIRRPWWLLKQRIQ